MIIDCDINFESERDCIKTERYVFENNNLLNTPYQYVALPIAYCINTCGLQKTQKIINKINNNYKDIKIFVCQHILVKELFFENNIVFTPHTTYNDSMYVIPHYNSLYNDKPDNIVNKNRLCSFVGDFNTNSIRPMLLKFKSNEILIENTNGWFFDKRIEEQNILKENYKSILEESYFSFCPEGTGPSTLRLYESISVGSFPIIFNNVKIPKLLEPFVIRADINDINFNLLKKKYTENMRLEMQNIYWENYCNKYLYRSINIF